VTLVKTLYGHLYAVRVMSKSDTGIDAADTDQKCVRGFRFLTDLTAGVWTQRHFSNVCGIAATLSERTSHCRVCQSHIQCLTSGTCQVRCQPGC